MSWFHLGATALLTLLVILVALPWFGRRPVSKSQPGANVKLVKERLAELDAEAEQGMMSEQDLRQARDELKLAMVDEHRSSAESRSGPAYLWIIAGALLAVVVGSVTYYQVNQLAQLKQSQQAIEALPALSEKLQKGAAQAITDKDIAQLALAIRQRLYEQPDDAKGWMFLARMQASLNRSAQALEAMAKAYQLTPQTDTVASGYAQLLMGTGEREQVILAKEVLESWLSRQPEDVKYVLMAAVASAQLGDLAATERYFGRIKSQLPPDSEMRRSLEQRIVELGGQSSPSSQTALEVTVMLAENIRQKGLPEDGYLIVFAQQKNEKNRMPAAVVKQPLSRFPITITLGINDAMIPDFTLAHLKQVKLVARISADQDVMPSAGDLQGTIFFDLEQGRLTQHAIKIDKELK